MFPVDKVFLYSDKVNAVLSNSTDHSYTRRVCGFRLCGLHRTLLDVSGIAWCRARAVMILDWRLFHPLAELTTKCKEINAFL